MGVTPRGLALVALLSLSSVILLANLFLLIGESYWYLFHQGMANGLSDVLAPLGAVLLQLEILIIAVILVSLHSSKQDMRQEQTRKMENEG